jgi:uncharacterized protein YjbJ (UPF0337 family)
MNWSKIEIDWQDFKANAKQEWSKLSEQQINDTFGKRDYLSLRVQEAYAQSKEVTERQISDWQGRQVAKQAPSAKT